MTTDYGLRTSCGAVSRSNDLEGGIGPDTMLRIGPDMRADAGCVERLYDALHHIGKTIYINYTNK